MSSNHALIYFIHDDINIEFENILSSNILKATVPAEIKVLLAYNRRIVNGDHVFYTTEVSELITEQLVPTRLKLLSVLTTWQEAFRFMHNHLTETKFNTRIGLIVLSHSGGIVINRNNDTLPVIKNRNLLVRLKNGTPIENNRYVVKTKDKDSFFLSTKTIVDTAVPGNTEGQLFKQKYIRQSNIPFCKTYEGLFTFQLSDFFKANNLKFGFIIFSNCTILIYDNGFLFTPYTDFIIGAETDNNMHTWDFPTIINVMEKNLSASPLQMIKEIFSKCLQNFSTISTDKTYRYFLMQSINFPSLNKLFEDIISSILNDVRVAPSYKTGLLEWVKHARATNERIPFFDLIMFFQAANKLAKNKLDNSINAFSKLLKENIIVDRNVDDPSFCGFSIFLPRTKQQFESLKGGICNYFDVENKNDFTLHSLYDDLLQALFELNPET